MEYTIPLRKKYYKAPRHERSKKAVDVLRKYLIQHTKADEVKIGQHLNEFVWARGIRSPPPRVTVISNVIDVDGQKVAQVELKGFDFSQSVRPDERVEEESGLKGKLQALTQGKKKAEDEEPAAAPSVEERETPSKAETTQEKKPAEDKESAAKTPSSPAKKTPAKTTNTKE